MKVIGTDEAGYGPNYGPLIVTASLWETDDPEFVTFSHEAGQSGLSIGDSKKLYHGGGSLALLEKNVLGILKSIKIQPKSDTELFLSLSETGSFDLCSDDSTVTLPFETDDTRSAASLFLNICSKTHIILSDICSRTVFAEEFNKFLNRHDSKGSMLSNLTMELVAKLLNRCEGDCLVLCDKHGGRNRYLDLLSFFFPDEMIWIDQESRESSVYRLKQKGRSLEFRFIAKGESQIPIAFSSMVSKYLRELAMNRFNAFWQKHIPNLRPTAGYPEDAKRFKQDIADTQKRLDIDDDLIWRKK